MSDAEFDFIVIGAGSAGCALAARLSEDPERRVLLLEAGEDDRWIWLRIPTGIAKVMVGERALWRFETEPEPGIGGRSLYWPRGKLLGGTSRVNGMFWVRGDPLEYDHWRDLGNPGWGYADVLPYFRRMESYAGGDPTVRGRAGPLVISDYGPRDATTEAFLRACAEAGFPENPDYNGGDYSGAAQIQFSTRRGLRWDAREAYLRPSRARRNLRIVTGAHVTRLLIEDERAIGVAYRRQGEAREVRARRELALCAGTVQSPQLLELSGVGDAARLDRLGIPVRRHLPGVGENLRDHLHSRIMFEVRGLPSLNRILRSPWAKLAMAFRFAVFRDGLMSVPGATAHAYVRSEPDRTQPDLKLQLHLLTSPDERNPRRIVLDDAPGFSIGMVHQQPHSRGSIHVRSADPFAAPTIQPNYLADSRDLEAFIRGMRVARRVAAQPSLARHIVRELRPGPEAQSDEAIAEYLRRTIFSSYHPVGTCRMGDDARAVVDTELRVRGIRGLRVADASVMPTIPASNTNAAAILMGERAADWMLAAARS